MGDAEGILPPPPLKNRVRIVKKFLQTPFSTNDLLCQDRIGSVLDLV